LKFDDFTKSRHSRAGGTQKSLKRLDSRFHGNDRKTNLGIFYEGIKFDDPVKSSHSGANRSPEHL
jgi:hypothetical protein